MHPDGGQCFCGGSIGLEWGYVGGTSSILDKIMQNPVMALPEAGTCGEG
jgi:hypothetical protein